MSNDETDCHLLPIYPSFYIHVYTGGSPYPLFPQPFTGLLLLLLLPVPPVPLLSFPRHHSPLPPRPLHLPFLILVILLLLHLVPLLLVAFLLPLPS